MEGGKKGGNQVGYYGMKGWMMGLREDGVRERGKKNVCFCMSKDCTLIENGIKW